MKIMLNKLPRYNQILKGKKINVIRQGGKYHYDYQDKKKIRIFVGAKFKIEKGKKWIYWYWQPKMITGEYDCGYSGVTISSNYNGSYLKVKTKKKYKVSEKVKAKLENWINTNYKTSRYTGRGVEYVKDVIQSHIEGLQNVGYTIISRHESKNGEVLWYPRKPQSRSERLNGIKK